MSRYLRKEDGDRLLLESGGRFVLLRTLLTPSVGIEGRDYRLFIESEEGGLDGTTTVSLGADITVDAISVTDANHLVVDVSISSGASLGYRDLTVTTGANIDVTVDAFRLVAEGAETTFRNGFQYTLLTRGDDIRRSPGIVIRDVLNNQPNTCQFIVDGTSNAPTIGEKIEIRDSFDGNRLLFAGIVQVVEQIYEGQTDQLAWNVQCIDFTWLFNRRRPFGSYRATSVSDVVKDLVALYAPGFSTDHVQTNLAKVTVTLDGSDDFVTVMNKLAQAIGGGHWYIDYNQDVHFFHVVPPGLEVPPSEMSLLGDPIVLSQGSGIPASFSFPFGYYFVRYTFIYDDGTESKFSSISNLVLFSGNAIMQLDNVPVGPTLGNKTCVGRRIYYNRFVPYGYGLPPQPIEDVKKFCQINDNMTTSFTTWFGSTGASVGTIGDVSATSAIPNRSFNGHPVGPAGALSASPRYNYGDLFWNGGWFQFKVACLYRDGSVSFPGPASTSAGIKNNIRCTGLRGWDFTNIPVGEEQNGSDVVARFIYYSMGMLADPNYSISWSGTGPGCGFVWPIPSLEPDWAKSHTGGIVVIPDNMTTSLLAVSLAALNSSYSYLDPGVLCGQGNLPYDNGAVLSVDPIPIWPNPDGPSLEDVDPPGDLTDNNGDLLHGDSGSQPFSVTTDLSQVRNRVIVVGSGSLVTATAAVGGTIVYVADIASFSPAGGRVKIQDPGTGKIQTLDYIGVDGVVSKAGIVLAAGLAQTVAQGSTVNNYFQADDFESQKFLAKAELDFNGLPTDGIHEYTIVDTSLKAVFQLFMRAYAELELFSKPVVQIRYATRDPKSRTGQTVHVDMSNPPCTGDFLIQEVQIDQIRDEGDDLAPRYTVTASSTKFELNDLLLQILGASIGGGGSGAGVVVAAVTTSATQSAVTSGLPNPAPSARRWASGRVTTGTSHSDNIFGCPSSIILQTTGVSAGQADVYPGTGDIVSHWVRFTPASNNGNLCGYSTGAAIRWASRPKFVSQFRTANLLRGNIGASHRVYWIGMIQNADPTAGSATLNIPHIMLLCDDPADGGGSWQTSIYTSGGQQKQNVGFAAIKPNTHYIVVVEATSLTTAKIVVNDVTNNVTNTANVTVSGFEAITNFGFVTYGTTPVMVASASYLDIASHYVESD